MFLAACLVQPMARSAELDFYRDVYPILKANCISCHNKTTTKAGLNMESPELMKKGGDTGPGLIPGKGAESLVVRAAAHLDEDLLMPPKNNKSGAVALTASEVELLKNWIDQGAKHSVQQGAASRVAAAAAGRESDLHRRDDEGRTLRRVRTRKSDFHLRPRDAAVSSRASRMPAARRIAHWCSRWLSARTARDWRAGVSAR